MEFKFKKDNPNTAARLAESSKIKEKYPDRIPIICEKTKDSTLKEIDKTKYLVPKDLTLSQFSYIVNKKLDLEKTAALFLLINGTNSVTGDTTVAQIYEEHKDKEDGFLYIAYTSEPAWGFDESI